MKKIISFCLILSLVCVSFITINVYQTRDKIRINQIERTNDSFEFFIKNSQKSLNSELDFFSELSANQNVSIFKTTNENEIVVKSVVFNKESFPFANFGIENKNLFSQSNYLYSSFNSEKKEGNIPVFWKENKIVLRNLSETYKDTSQSVNGNYTVVLSQNSSREKTISLLSKFFDVSEEELLNKEVQQSVGFVNQILMLITLLFISVVLVLLITNTYGALTEIKKFGVMKLNGISNMNILISYAANNIKLIFAVALIIDIIIFFYFPYHPNGFLITLIFSQIIVLFLFLFTNIITYITIRTVTINKMLKNFINFKYGIFLSYIVKGLIASITTILLIVISFNFNSLYNQQKINSLWENNGKLLTVDYQEITNTAKDNFLVANIENEKKILTMFEELEKSAGAYYISSQIVNQSQLPAVFGNDNKLNKNYEFMNINLNYLKTLPIYNEIKKDNSLQSNIESRTFLVPDSQKSYIQSTHLLQNILFDQYSSDEQEKSRNAEVPINIIYYNDSNFSIFTFDTELPPVFHHPIFLIFDSKNPTFLETLRLGDSGLANPIKIKKTSNNLTSISDSQKSINSIGLTLKFSTINSILSNVTNSYKDGIKILNYILIAVYILNVFTTIFLFYCIITSKKTKLAVYRLLGKSIGQKYKGEFITLSCFYITQILTCIFLGKSKIIIVYSLIIILSDLAIIYFTIRKKENNSLVNVLKGD